MAEMKNLCGKIPVELHIKVRQEIEEREISTQQFIQQVIEEHFTEKRGQVSMAVRTLAVQVSEELFARFKAAVAKKGCKQKDFLIGIIEKAIEEIENERKPDEAEAENGIGEDTTDPIDPESDEPELEEINLAGLEAEDEEEAGLEESLMDEEDEGLEESKTAEEGTDLDTEPETETEEIA